MQDLLGLAEKAGHLLKERDQTIALCESSMGGLVSAALVSVAGASAYFLGSTVIYTRAAAGALLEPPAGLYQGKTPLTEAYVAATAAHFRQKMGADWALAEMGAAGPQGSPYGPPPGTAAIALDGPVRASRIVKTGLDDRRANMRAFGRVALILLVEALEARA